MQDEEKPQLIHIYCIMVLLLQYSFKWQYMAESGAEAGAEIKDKGGAGAENK